MENSKLKKNTTRPKSTAIKPKTTRANSKVDGNSTSLSWTAGNKLPWI